jgi:formylglycine-generating enzyme required for sulfatase activity
MNWRRLNRLIRAAFLATAALGIAPALAASAFHAFRDCSDCPVMIAIPPGRFLMGSPPQEPGRSEAEGPVHEVVLEHGFAIGQFDVTLTQFSLFAHAANYQSGVRKCDWQAPQTKGIPLRQAANEPVVCVNWPDAQAYVAWLGVRTGKSYRLPSEAEWEYAARAGSTTSRPWGETLGHDDANYGADVCCGAFASGKDRWLYTSPVGAFRPNRFGLYDMLGNVWQWTQDCGSESYAGAPRDGSAWLAGDCDSRMVRGGAWFQAPDSLRSASRAADKADRRVGDIGFRVARSL